MTLEGTDRNQRNVMLVWKNMALEKSVDFDQLEKEKEQEKSTFQNICPDAKLTKTQEICINIRVRVHDTLAFG